MAVIGWQLCDGDIKLFIGRKKSGEVIEVFINIEDLEKIKNYNWLAVYNNSIKNYYILTSYKDKGKTKSVYLHRLLTECLAGLDVDHLNHNTLDNRRKNLRICTRLENMHNLKNHYRSGKITEKDLISILTDYTLSDRQTAKKYGVSQPLITNIRNGRAKAHLLPEIKRRAKAG